MNVHDVLEREKEKILRCLPSVDPSTKEYSTLLENFRTLCFMQVDVNFKPMLTEDAPPLTELPKPIVPEEKPVVFNSIDEKLDYAKVRAICANHQGTPLKPIILKYVPAGKEAKLSNVPESSYADLVKEILNA